MVSFPLVRRAHGAGILWVLVLLFVGSSTPLEAQRVQASVNSSQVSLEGQLQLTVSIEGTLDARPVLPELPDFRVVSRGGSQRETSIVNGAMTQRVSYRFLLIPSRVGKFTIGPVAAEIEGTVYRSAPFSVEVIPAGEQPEEQADVFLTVGVSNSNPYVGEQVIYTWRFYRRVRVADPRITALDFGDLVAEELGEVREYDTNYRGVPYRVSELKRALFAQKAGQITLEPAVLTCEVAVSTRRRSSILDFGRINTETRVLRSSSLELNVKPLPSPPSTFSGLVGNFNVRTSMSKDELKVGESATFEVRVQGTGNIQLMREPQFPELQAFKVYEDQPVTRIDRSGSRIGGSKTYRKALVPLAAGTVELPAIELVFFDPDQSSYRTERTAPISIDIAPGDGQEDLMLTESLNPGAGKVAVRVLADDILPIRTDFEALKYRSGEVSALLPWIAGALVPPLLVALLWAYGQRRRRFDADSGLKARQRAFRKAVSSLQQIAESQESIGELAHRTSSALRVYVGEKLGIAGEALTPAEVERSLVKAGVDAQTAVECRETLERLEALAYGGDHRRFTGKQLAQSAEQVLKSLEGQLGVRFRVDGREGGWFPLRSSR